MAIAVRQPARVSIPMLALLLTLGGVVLARGRTEGGPQGPCVLCDGPAGPFSGVPGLLGCATSSGGLGSGEDLDLSRRYSKPANLICGPTSGHPADCTDFTLCCAANSIGYFACSVAYTVDECQVLMFCAKRCCVGGRVQLKAEAVPACGKGAVSHTLICI